MPRNILNFDVSSGFFSAAAIATASESEDVDAAGVDAGESAATEPEDVDAIVYTDCGCV